MQGAMDLQHIQYRELGKGLQVWEGLRGLAVISNFLKLGLQKKRWTCILEWAT